MTENCAVIYTKFGSNVVFFCKNKLINVCLSMILILFSTQFSNASSRKANLTSNELAVLNFFEKKCDEFNAPASMFPDAFLDNYVQSSCELAALYNPNQFSLKRALLTAARSFVSGGVFKAEGDRSLDERLKHFDVKINTNTIYDDKEHQKTTHKLAFNGDPASINIITYDEELMPVFGGKGLKKTEVDQISQHIGQHAANFLFLSDTDLNGFYKNYEDIIKASDFILDQADQLSSWYLTLIVNRIVSSTLSVDPYDEFFHIEALKIPHELRINLMSLNTLTNEVARPLMEALWLIEFGTVEANNFFSFGTNTSFIDIRYTYLENKILSCAIQLSTLR